MNKLKIILALGAALLPVQGAWAQQTLVSAGTPKTLFWMSNGLTSVNSFLAHKDKIGIISPTWYQIDENGMVTGEPQPVVLKAAKEAHVPILPLFALFNPEKFHKLANDEKAQDEMNRAFVRECKENGYDGINYDIEDVMWTDRDALSAMVKKTAEVLHKEHLLITIDVVPGAPGHAGETDFGKWMFQEWRGGYDLQALGAAVDLLCLMTYDQSTHWTPPGPVGGWMWTKKNLDYAVQFVPREKLSLGIAAYGYRWYAGDPGLNKKEKTPNATADYISQATAISLRDTYGGKEQWDEADHTPWFFFYRDDMREWVFYTNTRAFMDRYHLAAGDHLEGVCSWVLGEEDPGIWSALPNAR
ncbi:MAG: glycosyl hydrolase family 18 protein [Janthinobacterium lividum]